MRHQRRRQAPRHRQSATLLLLILGFGPEPLYGLSLDAAHDRRAVLRRIGSGAAVAAVVAGVTLPPGDAALAADATETAASFPTNDPSRLWLPLPRSGLRSSVPRVGYSLYKTAREEAADGVALALRAGVRHFDVATQYGSNAAVGRALADYVRRGVVPLAAAASDERVVSPEPSRRERRAALVVTHKVSNAEQSTNIKEVMRAVERQRSLLQLEAIDFCLIHSPLTDAPRRLGTYRALLDLQALGRVRAVGVANYGIQPLQEIVDAGLPAPSVIQLALSPFNQHADVCRWAAEHGSTMSCSAWSKLSSTQGPQEGWAVLADVAKNCGMTKAQVLVRWAVQRGYLCAPRSSAKYKIDRQAIFENSWRGTQSFVLTDQQMAVLNRLDEQLPAGQLGLTDGWEAEDIVDSKWDPTLMV